ncbi:MAG: polysaccharide biosynthesis tyrosine autokinase [Paenisporosarcina sp.]
MKQGIVMRDIINVCKKRIKAILLTLLLFTITGSLIGVAIPATYQVQTDILVNYSTYLNPNNELLTEEINMNQSLIETYKYLLLSNHILHKVNEFLKEPYDTYDWENNVRVESSEDSQIISIVVQDSSSEQAALVANGIATSFQQEVRNVMKMENVNILNEVSAIGDAEMLKPPTSFYLLLSISVGILVNIMYIILKETYFTMIDSEEQVRKYLDLTILGYIPWMKRFNRNSEKVDGDQSLQDLRLGESISENFRTIRANLLFQMKRQNIKTVLITSSYSGEGKSFISVNLALFMSKNTKKTVFVDANLRKTKGRTSFNLSNEVGITTYIAGNSPLQDIIQKTEFDHLYFVGSGPLPVNPTEVLSSNKMKNIIDQLKQQFDVVIINSSSLSYVDPIILGTISDGCLFVINAQKTTKEHAIESLNQLTKVDVKMIGTILNKDKRAQGKTAYQ